VSVKNTGKIVAQLKGFRLRDRSGKSLKLPRYGLAPGATVKVFTGSGARARHRLFLGRRADIWGATHDAARLYDRSEAKIATLRY
jgi:hypothetical protein